MNKRYRRQMLLRSHRHRAGKLGACGCHKPQRKPMTWIMGRTRTSSFGDLAWRVPKRRKIEDLPDIATFQAGVELVRQMVVAMRPAAERVNAIMREMAEVINAQSQGPES